MKRHDTIITETGDKLTSPVVSEVFWGCRPDRKGVTCTGEGLDRVYHMPSYCNLARRQLVKLQGERFDLRLWCQERGADPWLSRCVLREHIKESQRIMAAVRQGMTAATVK